MHVLSKKVSIQICDPQFLLRGKRKALLLVSCGFAVLSLVILVMLLVRIPGLNASHYLYADSTRVFKYLYVRLILYMLYLCVIRVYGSSVPELEGSVGSLLWFVWVLCCHKGHLKVTLRCWGKGWKGGKVGQRTSGV